MRQGGTRVQGFDFGVFGSRAPPYFTLFPCSVPFRLFTSDQGGHWTTLFAVTFRAIAAPKIAGRAHDRSVAFACKEHHECHHHQTQSSVMSGKQGHCKRIGTQLTAR